MKSAKITTTLLLAVFYVLSICNPIIYSSAFANGLFEVTVVARGATQAEALASAIDDAIRRSLGAIFAERTQVVDNMLEERLIQFSRGTATNHTILDSTSDESGVVLTVRVTIDSSRLSENARTFVEGTAAGGIGQRRTPLLERGQEILADFIAALRYEDFMEVSLENQWLDISRGQLNVTVTLRFNRERYTSEFLAPLTEILTEIFASPALRQEIEGEFGYLNDRFAASFHILGENLSSSAWTLPRNFYETLRRGARFWYARNGRVQTHRRIWLHFSLLNSAGVEFERLPVHLGATNVLFFSENHSEPNTPWFFTGIETMGLNNVYTLIAAPRFGAMSGRGYEFHESFSQSFAFSLPDSQLGLVNNIRISLELER